MTSLPKQKDISCLPRKFPDTLLNCQVSITNSAFWPHHHLLLLTITNISLFAVPYAVWWDIQIWKGTGYKEQSTIIDLLMEVLMWFLELILEIDHRELLPVVVLTFCSCADQSVYCLNLLSCGHDRSTTRGKRSSPAVNPPSLPHRTIKARGASVTGSRHPTTVGDSSWILPYDCCKVLMTNILNKYYYLLLFHTSKNVVFLYSSPGSCYVCLSLCEIPWLFKPLFTYSYILTCLQHIELS